MHLLFAPCLLGAWLQLFLLPAPGPGEEEAQEGLFPPFAEHGLCFLTHEQRFSG